MRMRPHSLSPCPARRQAGFSLLEVGIVLFILTILLAGLSTSLVARQDAENLRNTRSKMTLVETALVQFVMQNRRLPCPADGRIVSGGASAGVEARNSGTGACETVTGTAGSQTHGVVPWASLGIAEADATDEWGQRFTYRAGRSTTTTDALNMFWCDPGATATTGAGKWTMTATCNAACTAATITTACTAPNNFLAQRGLVLRNESNAIIMDTNPDITTSAPQGAAFLVVSHGRSGGGGYTSNGQLRASTGTDGTREQGNYADTTHTAANEASVSYFDAAYSEADGTGHFDDLVLRPSLLSIINRAGLGPRPHS